MRKLLFAAALICAFSLARADESAALATNAVTLGEHGTLEILTPKDWTLTHTNLNLPGNPPSVELRSASNTVGIRLTIYWDGFDGRLTRPTEADMEKTISNVVVRQYVPISVEQTFTLEKFQGPAVTGSFARFTDAGWTPILKNEYRNITTGMFRCGNLWGRFDLYTNDKDGPQFKQGLAVMDSLRRKP